MNVDPLLEDVVDYHAKIAIALVGQEQNRETLFDKVLLTFAALGLAEAAKDQTGGAIWIQSKQLIDLQKASGPVDLCRLQSPTIPQQQPAMTQSLRLIMDDIIRVAQEKTPLCQSVKMELALLILARLAYVHTVGGSKYFWTASAELILYYQMGMGIEGLVARRKQKVKMDSALKTISIGYRGMSAMRLGGKLPRRVAEACTVLSLEWDGSAIAELDADGQLAWRADDETKSYFTENDEDACSEPPMGARYH